MTPEHFDETFNTNARGTYFAVQKALPHLIDGASIILVASASKNMRLPGRSTYSATKAALRSLARTWTSEFKDWKIRTNVLSTGTIETPMFDGQVPSKMNRPAFRLRSMCRVFGLHPSGYYAWRSSPLSERGKDDQRLLGFIQHAWLQSGGVYG